MENEAFRQIKDLSHTGDANHSAACSFPYSEEYIWDKMREDLQVAKWLIDSGIQIDNACSVFLTIAVVGTFGQ